MKKENNQFFIKAQNTRAIIEDFYKGPIGEIIFEEWGEDKNFIIFNKQKLANELGKDICKDKNKVTKKEIIEKVNDKFEFTIDLIIEYVVEYILENFEGELE
ncbi:MAG: hypothetical protein IKF82_00370 [Bacilli bacterium]|nr:hypothetical protein [Bacilli bacterium]